MKTHGAKVVCFCVSVGIVLGLSNLLTDSLEWFAFTITAGLFTGWNADRIVSFLEGKVR